MPDHILRNENCQPKNRSAAYLFQSLETSKTIQQAFTIIHLISKRKHEKAYLLTSEPSKCCNNNTYHIPFWRACCGRARLDIFTGSTVEHHVKLPCFNAAKQVPCWVARLERTSCRNWLPTPPQIPDIYRFSCACKEQRCLLPCPFLVNREYGN